MAPCENAPDPDDRVAAAARWLVEAQRDHPIRHLIEDFGLRPVEAAEACREANRLRKEGGAR